MENQMLENIRAAEVVAELQEPQARRPRQETLFVVILWTVLVTLLVLTLLSHAFGPGITEADTDELYRQRNHRWADSYGLPYKPKGL